MALIWSGWGWSVGLGRGLWEVAGRGASCFSRGVLRHEGCGGSVGDGGGAPCWVLLPPGLGRLGPNVIEDVLGASGLRCRCGAGRGLGFGLGCGLRSWRADEFGWLFGGGLGFRLGCGCGPRQGVGLGGGGGGICSRWQRVWGPVWEVFTRGLGGGVLDEDLVVVVDEVVVVVEVAESEAGARAVGDGGGPWASGAGVGCWVLQVARTRVRVRAPGVCARLPWLPVRAGPGVVALSQLCGHLGYPGGVHICSRTCGCVCWR